MIYCFFFHQSKGQLVIHIYKYTIGTGRYIDLGIHIICFWFWNKCLNWWLELVGISSVTRMVTVSLLGIFHSFLFCSLTLSRLYICIFVCTCMLICWWVFVCMRDCVLRFQLGECGDIGIGVVMCLGIFTGWIASGFLFFNEMWKFCVWISVNWILLKLWLLGFA